MGDGLPQSILWHWHCTCRQEPKQFLGYLHANGTDSRANSKASTETNTAPDKNHSNNGEELQCNRIRIEKARAAVVVNKVAAANKVAAVSRVAAANKVAAVSRVVVVNKAAAANKVAAVNKVVGVNKAVAANKVAAVKAAVRAAPRNRRLQLIH